MKRGVEKGTTVMCHDPSMTAWGWSIVLINEDRIIDCGVIKTDSQAKKLRIRKGDDRVRRIHHLNLQLKEVITKYEPMYHVSELPHGSQSASAAVMMGAVVGILQTISDFTNVGIEYFSENDAKKAVLGKGSASKGEMIVAINKRYDVPFTGVGYRDEAIADSLAVFHVAKQQSEVLKFLNR